MSARTARLAYAPVGMVAGMVGGAIATAAFRATWRAMAHEDEAPTSKTPGRDWQVVLLAAGLQGAVFAVVKAAVDRLGAHAFARATGEWPG